MTKAAKPVKVFISHAHADAPLVRSVVKQLISRGVVTENDLITTEEALPARHKSLRDDVKQTIQGAGKVVVIWGRNSAASQWVNYEIGLADALSKPITFVLLKDDVAKPPAHVQNAQVFKLERDV